MHLAAATIPVDPATQVPTLAGLGTMFTNIVTVILAIAGIAFFVLLLGSGFKFMTSGGDPKAVEGAKKTLTYAIAGLIIILLSYLILVLIKTLTGVDVTTFTVVQP
jgi:hypothetical protein